MPYQLAPIITSKFEGMWFEGPPYIKESIYQKGKEGHPPVNYDAHTLKPHSLTHIESGLHTSNSGKALDYYLKNHPNYFFGKCSVIKIDEPNWQSISGTQKQYQIKIEDIKKGLLRVNNSTEVPEKVIITTTKYPQISNGFHDPSFILTLSLAAAEFLVSESSFHLYGTSWKSSDFNPGSKDRPIHNTLFSQALILELLNLQNVPEGNYFLNCFPIGLEGASEAPVMPILYCSDELKI